MSRPSHKKHNELIVEQFSRQAVPFSQKSALSSEASLEVLFELTAVSAKDTVLDVACGPGLVAVPFARRAGRVVGVDLTPAMIERAQALQREEGLTNLSWHVADVMNLPFPEESFSIVFTRYSFHHFPQPEAVLKEMTRVCKTGGQVVVIDAAPSPETQDAYNRMERLRDPSHVRAFTNSQLERICLDGGLRGLKERSYRIEFELEKVLAGSFPASGDLPLIRTLFEQDAASGILGMQTHSRDGVTWISYPTLLLAGRK